MAKKIGGKGAFLKNARVVTRDSSTRGALNANTLYRGLETILQVLLKAYSIIYMDFRVNFL